MNTSTIYLDLIFSGKNKDYGAYELRKNYPNRLLKSLLIALSVVFIFILVSFINKDEPVEKPLFSQHEVRLTEVKTITPPEEIKKEKVVENKQVKTVKFTPPVIVDDDKVKDPVPTEDELKDVAISTENRDGVKDSGLVVVDKGDPNDGVVKEEPKVDYDKEFISVQKEASFPGGMPAWIRFLQTNLNGDVPVSNGAPEGMYTVIISFLVDKEGKISEVRAVNDPGYGVAEEAIRVIKKSKVWIPAESNNHKVIYRQSQKITFMVGESE